MPPAWSAMEGRRRGRGGELLYARQAPTSWASPGREGGTAEATSCPRRGCALWWAWTSASSLPAVNGQLGHGDTLLRNLPTVVSELSKYNIIEAGVGRKHTVVVTDEGKSFAFGDNKHGQLGTGSLKKVELGVKVEEYARGKGHLRNVFVTNALLEMYAKCGSIQRAWQAASIIEASSMGLGAKHSSLKDRDAELLPVLPCFFASAEAVDVDSVTLDEKERSCKDTAAAAALAVSVSSFLNLI
ncbi:hypothetical protein ZWY2020_051169 [Hordeum vulgare]|nr:hypothetical protein ZWY2020_051169 [Hordeum vulgare]